MIILQFLTGSSEKVCVLVQPCFTILALSEAYQFPTLSQLRVQLLPGLHDAVQLESRQANFLLRHALCHAVALPRQASLAEHGELELLNRLSPLPADATG